MRVFNKPPLALQSKHIWLFLIINALPILSFAQDFQPAQWYFEENKGQLYDESSLNSHDIRYFGRQAGAGVYCMPGKIIFIFNRMRKEGSVSEANGTPEAKSSQTVRVVLKLSGANPSAILLAADPVDLYAEYNAIAPYGVLNYYNYRKLIYQNIYPNIDFVLEPSNHGLLYSFNLKPGADAKNIQMKWEGPKYLNLTKESNMSFRVSFVKIEDSPKLQPAKETPERLVLKENTVTGFQIPLYKSPTLTEINRLLQWQISGS